MPDTDIAAAARPVTLQRAASYMAELTRMFSDMVEGGDTIPIRKDALLALLPVLDAVGAEPGADRVERTTAGIVAEMQRQADASGAFGLGYFDPDDVSEAVVDGRVDLTALASATIALADAEKAAEPLVG